jgi:hypothetical protein
MRSFPPAAYMREKLMPFCAFTVESAVIKLRKMKIIFFTMLSLISIKLVAIIAKLKP